MKETPDSYAVVIVTHNRQHMLEQCLKHAVFQTLRPAAVVVVNNASTDGTRQYLDELKKNRVYSDIKLLICHEKENVGGAGGFHDGMKLAMKHTEARWILVIDDDAVLDYDCCEKMRPGYDEETVTGQPVLAKACAVYGRGSLELTHRKDRRGAVPVKRYTEDTFFCTSTSFCGSMFHRSLIEKIGYPRKDYFIWFDDTEYSMRVNRHSSILVFTGASLQHGDPEAPDRSAVVDWRYYYGTRNHLDMLRRHRKPVQFLQFTVTVGLIILLRDIRMLLHCADPSEAMQDRKEKQIFADGLKDGLRGKLGKNPGWLPGQQAQ